MAAPPDITIVTPWLDHAHFITDYERAVSAPGIEVIVIDNGSAEPHATQIREVIDRLGGNYIRNETNRWFAAANNQGLAAATGRIVLFLNNDIAADPAWLDAVRADVTEGGLYGPSLLGVDLNGRRFDYIEGWCVAAQRDVWTQLGGWDAAAHSMPYWEDNDLSFRAMTAGIRLVQTQWQISHKGKGTCGDVPGVRLGYERGRESFLRRLAGGPAPASKPPIVAEEPADRATVLLRGGQLPEAEQEYRSALAREPERADLWARYGEVLHLSGRHDAAIEALRRAAQLQPATISHWINLAAILGRREQYSESADALRRALELVPDSPDAWNNLSRALLGQGQFEHAMEAARKALIHRPNFVQAHVNLSHALRSLGRLDEALTSAKAAIAINPQSVVALNAAGAALRALGRPQEALSAYEHSLSIAPQDKIAQEQRAELLNPCPRSNQQPT